MQETRRARLQSVIQEELARVVPREIKDPRVAAVTFTAVEVTQDGSQATVYISLFGSSLAQSKEQTPEEEQDHINRTQLCIAGLSSASGFLRRHLAKVLTVRNVPTLIFKEDRGLANSSRVHELLKQVHASSSSKSE